MAAGAAEVAEEGRFRRENEARVVALESCLIGLHRTVEGEKVRILAIGRREDLVARGIALAADLIRLLLRVSD